MGVTRDLCVSSRACIYGGVERRDDPSRKSITHHAEERPETDPSLFSSFSLHSGSPSSRPLSCGQYRRTLWYIRVYAALHGSLPHPVRLFLPLHLLAALSPSTRAIATVIIPRCKRHNLVTVSPGISFSNDTAFIMREVRRPRDRSLGLSSIDTANPRRILLARCPITCRASERRFAIR